MLCEKIHVCKELMHCPVNYTRYGCEFLWDKIYIFGGQIEKNVENLESGILEYNPVNNYWSESKAMLTWKDRVQAI